VLGLKIVISADIEGISTVVSMKQVNPGTKEYERARRQITGK
jgi:D-aminopeptidase